MKKKDRKYEIDMCNGPILGKMLAFGIPLMFSNILQILFNAVDIIVVGQFAGDDALAAVGATTSLISLLTQFFIGLSVGVNVWVAKYYASQQEQQMKETVHTAIVIAAVCGVFLMFLGMFVAPLALRWMSTPENILGLSILYVRTYFVGIVAMLLYNFGAAILCAVGDTKRPMTYLIIAGISNIILNLFFVIVLKLGVAGVGIASAISQIISASLVIRCLIKAQGMIHLEIKALGIYKDKLKKILTIGMPTGIQNSLFNIANVTIQSSVNLFGDIIIAGTAAAGNVGNIIHTAQESFSRASLTFTSQNMGAKKYDRLTRILFTSIGCIVVTGIIFGGGSYLIGPWILSLYTTSDAVVAAGMVKLGIVGVSYALDGIMNVFAGALRGMGKAVSPMIITLFGSCLFRILWLKTIFQMERFHTVEVIYYVYPVSWIFTTLMLAGVYLAVKRKISQKNEKNVDTQFKALK